MEEENKIDIDFKPEVAAEPTPEVDPNYVPAPEAVEGVPAEEAPIEAPVEEAPVEPAGPEVASA
jgi:hypothetical protein